MKNERKKSDKDRNSSTRVSTSQRAPRVVKRIDRSDSLNQLDQIVAGASSAKALIQSIRKGGVKDTLVRLLSSE